MAQFLMEIMRLTGPVPRGNQHPMTGTRSRGIAHSSGQAYSHRFITDLTDGMPYWTGGNPCYRIIEIGSYGFRAYDARGGEVVTGRAPICEGP